MDVLLFKDHSSLQEESSILAQSLIFISSVCLFSITVQSMYESSFNILKLQCSLNNLNFGIRSKNSEKMRSKNKDIKSNNSEYVCK